MWLPLFHFSTSASEEFSKPVKSLYFLTLGIECGSMPAQWSWHELTNYWRQQLHHSCRQVTLSLHGSNVCHPDHGSDVWQSRSFYPPRGMESTASPLSCLHYHITVAHSLSLSFQTCTGLRGSSVNIRVRCSSVSTDLIHQVPLVYNVCRNPGDVTRL